MCLCSLGRWDNKVAAHLRFCFCNPFCYFFWSLPLSLTNLQNIGLNTHLAATNCCLTIMVPWNSMLLISNGAPLFLCWKPLVTYLWKLYLSLGDGKVKQRHPAMWNQVCVSPLKFLHYCILLSLRSCSVFFDFVFISVRFSFSTSWTNGQFWHTTFHFY